MVKFEDGKVELLKRRSVKPSAVRGSSLIKQKAAATAAPAAAATEGSSAATMDDSGAARPRGLGLPVLSEAPEAVTKDCRGKIEEALQRLNCSKDVKQRLSSAVDDIPVPADASTSRAFGMAEEALPTATKGCKDKASDAFGRLVPCKASCGTHCLHRGRSNCSSLPNLGLYEPVCGRGGRCLKDVGGQALWSSLRRGRAVGRGAGFDAVLGRPSCWRGAEGDRAAVRVAVRAVSLSTDDFT